MNPGIQLASAMWALTALSLLFVGLRLYTRIRIIKFVGAEDHMYAWTGVFLLVFTCAIQVCVHYGLGQSFWLLSFDNSSNAIFWTYVANSFAITGNAMAKLSMGLFLLRVVQLRWHKIALWVLVVITVGTSIALTIMLWNQTTPVKASWDPLRTPGKWNIQIQPLSVGLGAWSSVVDFFFAIFPWLIIWSLRMTQREKVMLAGGMSLGVIAGVCGIVRTVVLSRLDVYNYTLNFVPYFGWAGAEIAVSMICVGIPTLRPLYLKKRHGVTTMYGNRGQTTPSHDQLPRFTMVDQKRNSKSPTVTTTTTIKTMSPPRPPPAALASRPLVFGKGAGRPSTAPSGVMKGKPFDLESETTVGRDSGSSYGSRCGVMSSPAGRSTADEDAFWAGAAVAFDSVAARPATAHARGGRGMVGHNNDSVDEILGLYDRNPGAGGKGNGTIWAKSEVRIRREDDLNWPLRS